MAEAYSISVAHGDTAERHDRREYTPDNADRRLLERNNVIIDVGNEREWFNDLFADSIADYNAKQTRKDRMKSEDYYAEIEESGNGEHQFYEYVIQIGNRDDNGVTTPDFDVTEWKDGKENYNIASVINNSAERLELKAVLDGEMGKLPERYPDFRFSCIVGHDDEPNGTYHYHVRFTPVGTGYKKGMLKRCALNKALAGMGFKGGEGEYPIHQWANDVKDHIEQAMNEKGFTRQFMSNEEKRLSVPEFKHKMRLKDMEAAEAAAFDKMVDALEEVEAIKAGSDVEYATATADMQIERHELQIERQEFLTKAQDIQQKINQKVDEMAGQERDLDDREASILQRAAEVDERERVIARKEAAVERYENEIRERLDQADQLLTESRTLHGGISKAAEDQDTSRQHFMESQVCTFPDGKEGSWEDAYQASIMERNMQVEQQRQEMESLAHKADAAKRKLRFSGDVYKFLHNDDTGHNTQYEPGL